MVWGMEPETCLHPEDERAESIGHLGEEDWAYCYGCSSVLHLERGVWVPQLTGITRASYR